MTTLELPHAAAPADSSALAASSGRVEADAAVATSPLAGNPGTLGLPVAIVGATGLVIVNAGWLSAGATAATVSILIGSTGIGLLIAAVWAAALGQNSTASIFGSFSGFYISYSALVLGLGHNWYGTGAAAGTSATETFLIAWTVLFAVLTLVTLRLPLAFTITFVAVVVALVLLLLGASLASVALTRAGAGAVFVFLAVVVYVYADAMLQETGGAGLPLGRPVVGAQLS